MSLFAANRERLCRRLREDGGVAAGAVVVLQGGQQECLHSSDREIVFRQVCVCWCVCERVFFNVGQESYFHWLFGVTEADCFGAVEVSALLFCCAQCVCVCVCVG